MASVQDRLSILLSWSSSHNALLHPSAEIYPDPQTGLSFRVKPDSPSPIPPHEPIVSLPTSLSLSYLNAIHPTPVFGQEFLSQTPPHVIGRLFLIREYLRAKDSFWHPYIQSLPQPEDHDSWALPPFWSDEEAELLDGTNIEVGIEKIRADIKREFNDAKQLLTSSQDDNDSSFAHGLTKELYHWSYCIFSSRSFRPGLVLSPEQESSLPQGVSTDDFSVLLPLFDIGNHDMTAPIQWDLQPSSSSSGYTCNLKVGKEHHPGSQIFNNYSPKTNAELLLGYGFIVPPTEDLHNDYTHVRKRTTTTTSSDSNTAAVEEYIISLRPITHPSSILALSKQTLVVQPTPPLPPVLGSFQHVQHDMVWDIFCTLTKSDPLLCAKLIAVDEAEAADKDTAERLRQEKFFSGQVIGECRFYLEQTVAIIQHKVLQELERLDETDVEVAGDDADFLTQNQKLALEYRERCRQVLENTLEAISKDDVLQFEDEDDEGEEGFS